MDKRQVMLQVISNLSCRNVWAAALVNNGVLCTASAGGMSVCGGDSGGPLVTGSGTSRTLVSTHTHFAFYLYRHKEISNTRRGSHLLSI